MNTTAIAPHFVNVQGASTITGLAVHTLNQMRCNGGGPPFVKAGRAVRYKIAALHAWMEERTVASTADHAATVAGDAI